MRHKPRNTLLQTFAIPLTLAIATVAGLILGLTGDGWRDLASWLLLIVSLLPIRAAFARRRSSAHRNARLGHSRLERKTS